MKKQKKILFACGGTGGHIYPAISLANLLDKKDIHSIFIGGEGGMEESIVPKAGFKLHLIKVKGLNRVSSFQKLFSLALLPIAILKSFILLLKEKPNYVMGTGGYVSGPVLFAASILGKKTGILELNSKPGMANKILYRFVKDCFVVFEKTKENFSKAILSGFPVREDILNIEKKKDRTYKNILIFGGSLGAGVINETVLSLLEKKPTLLENVRIRVQVGKRNFDELKHIEFENVEMFPFIDDIASFYQWADIVISRAGASTLFELSAARKASILIPLPTAGNDHQMINANILKDAAIIIEQKNFTPEVLLEKLETLIGNKEKIEELESAISKFYDKDALDKTIDAIYENF